MTDQTLRDALDEIDYLTEQVKRKDYEIANHIAVNSLLTDSDGEAYLANKLYNIKDEMHKKDVAFKLITGQQCEELESLKKFLEEIRSIAFAEFYTEQELLHDIQKKFTGR